MSKIFLDTNILVYCLDCHDLNKQKKSRFLLKMLKNENRGVISTQVLQEFFVVSTKKLGIDPLTAKGIITSFQKLETVVITPEIITDAIDLGVLHHLSFWDALIVAAAEIAHCDRLWTEDLNDGQLIRNVRIENPL